MRSTLLLFMILCFSLPSSGQREPNQKVQAQSPDRLLVWHKEKPLRWDNFKGSPESGDVVHGAVTFAGIELEVDKAPKPKGYLIFKAKAIFDQNRSWVKPGKPDNDLLAHEQLHFDIAEVFARKLEKKLNSLKLQKPEKEKVKYWQRYYNSAQLAYQKRYDQETLHGIRKEQQKVWRQKIDQQLLLSPKSAPPTGSHLAFE